MLSQADGVEVAQLPVSASERNTWRKPEETSLHNVDTK